VGCASYQGVVIANGAHTRRCPLNESPSATARSSMGWACG
jgi:hypothetical protein